jgi:hypothetical protein
VSAAEYFSSMKKTVYFTSVQEKYCIFASDRIPKDFLWKHAA